MRVEHLLKENLGSIIYLLFNSSGRAWEKEIHAAFQFAFVVTTNSQFIMSNHYPTIPSRFSQSLYD